MTLEEILWGSLVLIAPNAIWAGCLFLAMRDPRL
jgi:hypothetical protein